MLTLLLALSLIVPLPQTSLEQKIKTFRNHSRFKVKHDRFRDRTHVSVGPFFVGGTKAYISRGFRLEMSAHIFIAKQSDSDAYLVFESTSRRWTFLKNQELHALVDGERLSLGEGTWDAELRYRRVSEGVAFKIPLNIMSRIAKANSAELLIGSQELKLKDEHQQAIRDLLSLNQAAAVSTIRSRVGPFRLTSF